MSQQIMVKGASKGKCELCGESAEPMFGLFQYLCPKCLTITEKVLCRYATYLLNEELKAVVEILKRDSEVAP